MAKATLNTTIEKNLYNDIKKLALQLSIEQDKKVNVNELVEEGMGLILDKYKKEDEKPVIETTVEV